jgi:hypothetical protein
MAGLFIDVHVIFQLMMCSRKSLSQVCMCILFLVETEFRSVHRRKLCIYAREFCSSHSKTSGRRQKPICCVDSRDN